MLPSFPKKKEKKKNPYRIAFSPLLCVYIHSEASAQIIELEITGDTYSSYKIPVCSL